MEHLIVSRLAQHINPFWILGWKDEPPSYYEVMGHAQFEHMTMKKRYPKDNSLVGPFPALARFTALATVFLTSRISFPSVTNPGIP